jgi:hypothetical protein
VNNSANLTHETIGCSASAVVPSNALNLLGGDNLTISGTNFPWNLPTSNVSIAFADAQTTPCTPQWSTSTTLVCLTGAFDTAASQGSTISMTIMINNQTVTHSLSLTLMSTTKAE